MHKASSQITLFMQWVLRVIWENLHKDFKFSWLKLWPLFFTRWYFEGSQVSLSAAWNRPFLLPMASAGDVGALHREKMLFSPSAPLKTLSVSSGCPTLQWEAQITMDGAKGHCCSRAFFFICNISKLPWKWKPEATEPNDCNEVTPTFYSREEFAWLAPFSWIGKGCLNPVMATVRWPPWDSEKSLPSPFLPCRTSEGPATTEKILVFGKGVMDFFFFNISQKIWIYQLHLHKVSCPGTQSKLKAEEALP